MTKIWFLITCVLLSVSLSAQRGYNKDKLKKQSTALQNQIKTLSKSLNESNSSSKKSILYIKELEEKIDAQAALVNNTTKQKRLLEDEIYLSQLDINKLRRELSKIKEEYKEILVNAYKNKSMQNKVLFVLASESFTQAFRRVKYLDRYGSFQDEKASDVKEKQAAIGQKISLNKKAKNDKLNVLAKQKVLKENLGKERSEQNKILAEYRSSASEIQEGIREKEKESQALNAKIEAIIQEEIRIAAEKEAERQRKLEEARKERERLAKIERERVAREVAAAKAAKLAKEKADAEVARNREAKRQAELAANTNVETTVPVVTKPKVVPKPVVKPEVVKPKKVVVVEEIYDKPSDYELLATGFESNKGKLPWPLAEGKVIGKFGTHPHPIVPNITVVNNGVNIATRKGANARAVYEGTVSSVMSLQGGNKAIMVSHGSYNTVYNNLSSVFVNKGDKVTTKQAIGRIYTDSENNTILDFQVWKKTKKQNPASWVSGL